MNTEIERQWIVTDHVSLSKYLEDNCSVLHDFTIVQSYVSIDSNNEVRIRMITGDGKNNKCVLTVKSIGGLVRKETEIDISIGDYSSIRQHIDQDSIIKHTRIYSIEVDGKEYKLEFNTVDNDKDTGYRYVEIEFSSKEESDMFSMPTEIDKYLREVTSDDSYKMRNYWLKTRG